LSIDKTTDCILDFLDCIGLAVEERPIRPGTFLPGIAVLNGVLIVDRNRLLYPGDLLHEAGHLAVLTAEERKLAGPDLGGNGGHEMAAIAWSYAACVHLDLPLDIVFHPDGYKGDAAWLAQTFANGCYIGLPILEWKGMTSSDGDNPFPSMDRWLCA
jgi:hypothetical protein